MFASMFNQSYVSRARELYASAASGFWMNSLLLFEGQLELLSRRDDKGASQPMLQSCSARRAFGPFGTAGV
jgi:hypothetical protein